MARILIVGGGCRGRALASASVASGLAARVTTRSEDGRASIEQAGAECHIGTPARLATMRDALDGATVLCWLLSTASGPGEELRALHGDRLDFFMRQAIDTTIRGVVYESGAGALVRDGERRVREAAATHAIPLVVIDGPEGEARAGDGAAWLADAQAAVAKLLVG